MVKPGFRVQSVGFGGFQHNEYSHTGVRPGLGIAEQPVLSADHDRTDGVLHLVVADFNLAVIKERTKVLPLVQGVGNCLLQLVFW